MLEGDDITALESHQPVLGSIPRNAALALPSRHLGLVQAGETEALETFLDKAAEIVASSLDLDALRSLAAPRVPCCLA